MRPTPDRVKQAVFNSLGERVVGARVLELFAGSGALSLECLSRGANSALCVEKSRRHAEFIRSNAASVGLTADALQVRAQDVFTALRQIVLDGLKFDFILADPPYGEKNVKKRSESLAQILLDDPSILQVLKPGGLLILGHARRDTVSIPDAWAEVKSLHHGDNVMRFLQIAAVGPG